MNSSRQGLNFGFQGWMRRLALGCALVFSAGSPQAQFSHKPFSADLVKTVRSKTTTAKVNVTETAIRSEGVQDGHKYISIVRYDRKVMWSLMPDTKMYIEMPIPAGADAANGMKEMMKGVQTKEESLGSEGVNGFLCDKSRMTVTWQGTTSTTIEWKAKDLGGFAIKTKNETSGDSTEYKNIQPGPQDPLLFELPGGYKKIAMGGMMGQHNPGTEEQR